MSRSEAKSSKECEKERKRQRMGPCTLEDWDHSTQPWVAAEAEETLGAAINAMKMHWPGHNYINERAFRKLSCSNDPKIVEGRRGGDINLRLAHILAAFGTRNDWFPQRKKWGGKKNNNTQNNREKWTYAVMWIVSRLKIYADWSAPMPFSSQFTMLGPRGTTRQSDE